MICAFNNATGELRGNDWHAYRLDP